MFGLASISPTRASALFQRAFELRRHQPVLRISRVVLSECPVGDIARRLEVAQKGILNLVALASHITVRLDGGGNGVVNTDALRFQCRGGGAEDFDGSVRSGSISIFNNQVLFWAPL